MHCFSPNLLVCVVLSWIVLPAQSQSQSRTTVGGLIFSDYSYTISSPDGTSDGDNAFGYRRAYLTADFTLSPAFSGRVRLDGAGANLNAGGPPTPFVKDVHLTWKNALGDGHHVTFGISAPPVFQIAERQWGYRGLEKTVQDRAGIASSRDQGVKLNGPVTRSGSIRYAFMLANDTNVSRESDKYKKVYGQLEFYPSQRIHATVGGTYAARSSGSKVDVNGFFGYTHGRLHSGLEAAISVVEDNTVPDELQTTGVSFFSWYAVSQSKRLIGRVDVFETPTTRNTWFIAGFAFIPDPNVQFIPNVMYSRNNTADEPTITGRFTLIASF